MGDGAGAVTRAGVVGAAVGRGAGAVGAGAGVGAGATTCANLRYVL